VTYLRTFARFWWDFIVGDDWRLATGVVVILPLAFLAAHHGANPWWGLPIAVALLLTTSLSLAARRR
jgi:hypothetical protein